MMIRDDEVEAEAACGFSFGEGAHACVDGDHDANAIGVGRFEHARLHAVSVAQAMGHVETDFAAQHFDGGFQQDYSDSAVDVIIAVEKNGFSRGDGAFEALDSNGHPEHEVGIVEVRGFRVEEGKGLGGGGDPARDEQLGEDERQARLACERSRLVGMRLGYEPALGRQRAC
jgi:hypothetical protein